MLCRALNNIYLFTGTENEGSITRFLDVFNSNSNELDNYDVDGNYDEDDTSGTDKM